MDADKSLGQHWLNDSQSLEAMLEAGEVMEGDQVLEVGPGLGALTNLLLERGALVTAVEYDKRLIKDLQKKYDSNSMTLVEGDILQFDLSKMKPSYKVVANIPYYLTSKLLRNLLETDSKPSIIALLVQKEVAERIAASPGGMSMLSVSAQFYAQVELKEIVPAEFFEPAPKVDSQIIQLRPRGEALYKVDKPKFFRMVKSGFGERRKKLINSLSGGMGMEKENIRKVTLKSGLSENSRAQELSLEQWYKLYNLLYN